MNRPNPSVYTDLQRARDYVESVCDLGQNTFACRHSHGDCALWPGGPCADELIQLHNLQDPIL